MPSSKTKEFENDYARRQSAAAPHWERFHEFSKKLGDTSRAFAFAGIALIWVFKKQAASGEPLLPFPLVVAALSFIVGLASDLLRLFFAAFSSQYHAIYAFVDGRVEELEGVDRIMCKFFSRISLDSVATLLEMACVLIGFCFTLYHLVGVINIG